MSHIIIIGTGPTKPGFAATSENVEVEIKWTPSHDMAPAHERKTIEKLERIVERIVAVANGAEPTE